MFTKSIIQQTVESLHAKDNFRVAIEQLMEKYNIEDSVFVFKNGYLHEAVTGYFAMVNEFNNLSDAISACNGNMAVRVMENKLFQVGTLHNTISECAPESKVFDLDKLENIR